ncbi:MAG: amidophosphoribosyltransferase, partial [Patescibacteria group bacterium]
MSGLFGIVSPHNCAQELFYGTDYQSHLGTQKAGLATRGDRIYRSIHNISTAQFKSRFMDEIKEMTGKFGIGVISDNEPQPITISSSFGTFAIATSGLLANKDELAQEIMKKGGSFSEMSGGTINPTEVAGKTIATEKDILTGIKKLLDRTEGSLCILVMNEKGIYAARDRRGRTSLFIGRKDNSVAISSETSAFPNLGFKKRKNLKPGEIVYIHRNGEVEELEPGNVDMQICSFLWIYTGYPASSYEDISVEAVREQCGRNLAKNDDIEADFVTGVPDSGIAHGLGYALESGIPYRRSLLKYTPGYGRSYTPPSQDTRDRIAKMKLIPAKEIIKGKKIVICDDSIVRGTQLRNQALEKLWDCGAKEIHVRIGCPPLLFPCPYLRSTETKRELAARRALRNVYGKEEAEKIDSAKLTDPESEEYKKMIDYICQEMGATSLKYQSIEDMAKAIGLPR